MDGVAAETLQPHRAVFESAELFGQLGVFGDQLGELGLGHESLPGSAVDGEVAQGVVLVVVGGLAVDPEGFEAGMPGDLCDEDEILAAADEFVDEGVPADVGGGLVGQARVRGDGGEDIARTALRQAAAAAVEEQRPLPVGVRPSAAGIDPVLKQGAKLRVDRHLADLAALAVDDQDALAGRQPYVVEVQCDGIADAQSCVEGGEGERAIADVGPLTYGAQPPDLRVGVKRPGCGPGERRR